MTTVGYGDMVPKVRLTASDTFHDSWKPFMNMNLETKLFKMQQKSLPYLNLDNKSLFFLHVNERDELFQYPNILPPFLPLA